MLPVLLPAAPALEGRKVEQCNFCLFPPKYCDTEVGAVRMQTWDTDFALLSIALVCSALRKLGLRAVAHDQWVHCVRQNANVLRWRVVDTHGDAGAAEVEDDAVSGLDGGLAPSPLFFFRPVTQMH